MVSMILASPLLAVIHFDALMHTHPLVSSDCGSSSMWLQLQCDGRMAILATVGCFILVLSCDVLCAVLYVEWWISFIAVRPSSWLIPVKSFENDLHIHPNLHGTHLKWLLPQSFTGGNLVACGVVMCSRRIHSLSVKFRQEMLVVSI